MRQVFKENASEASYIYFKKFLVDFLIEMGQKLDFVMPLGGFPIEIRKLIIKYVVNCLGLDPPPPSCSLVL